MEPELQTGQKILIRPLHTHDITFGTTPLRARGQTGTIVRLNKASVTVDIMDGRKPIYVNYYDIIVKRTG